MSLVVSPVSLFFCHSLLFFQCFCSLGHGLTPFVSEL
jgi:hypothetical protein